MIYQNHPEKIRGTRPTRSTVYPMRELGEPPTFGVNGKPPPLHSPEVVVERFFFEPTATSYAIPSNALQRLLEGPVTDDFSLIAARRWALDSLSGASRPEADVVGGIAKVGGPAHDTPKPLPLEFLREFLRDHPGAGRAFVEAGVAVLSGSIVKGGAAVDGVATAVRRRRQQPVPPPDVARRPRAPRASVPTLEVRRMRHSQRWVRDPDIYVLPPGTSHQYTQTTSVGLSSSITAEIGAKLGLGHDFKIVQLNAELNRRLSHQLSVNAQRAESFTVGLQNDQFDFDRHYAMWRTEDRLAIGKLVCMNDTLQWQLETDASFYRSAVARYTMAHVARQGS